MSHTMKLWKRVIECRLRDTTKISENKFGFMLHRFTIKPIFLLTRLMKIYKEKKKNLYMVFIDLEKVYDRVTSEVLW